MKEQWKPVIGYEGLYEVSNCGQVKSVKFKSKKRTRHPRGRILDPKPTKRGYKRITLRKASKRKAVFLHVMVLEAFVGPRPKGAVTNHKNGNKADNHVENLEWVTQKENVHHAIKHGNFFSPKGEQCGSSKLTANRVKEIRHLFSMGNFTKVELAGRFGVTDVLIGKIIRREIWRHI